MAEKEKGAKCYRSKIDKYIKDHRDELQGIYAQYGQQPKTKEDFISLLTMKLSVIKKP